MKTLQAGAQLLVALTIFQPANATPPAPAPAAVTAAIDTCEQDLGVATGAGRLAQPIAVGIARFDRFGDQVPENLSEFLERELAKVTGFTRYERFAATKWFEYLYQTFLQRRAPNFGLRMYEATAVFPKQREYVAKAWDRFITDLRAAFAAESGARPQYALSRFDVFGKRAPTGEDVVALLDHELAIVTGYDRSRNNAARVWLSYLYQYYLDRPAPDLGVLLADHFLIFPSQEARLLNAWSTFIADLRERVARAQQSPPAPPKPATGLQLVPATPAPKPKPQLPALRTREVPGWTGPRPGRAHVDTVLGLTPEPRTVVIFLSQRYLRTVKISDAYAMDRLFDLAWAEFLPGRARQGHDYGRNAARIIDRGEATAELTAMVRQEWLTLRRHVETSRTTREAGDVSGALAGFLNPGPLDVLGGRASVRGLGELRDGPLDPRAADAFRAFVAKFTAHGKISDANGLYLVTLSALHALERVITKPVYVEARTYLRNEIGLSETEREGLRERRPTSLARLAHVIRLFQWALKSPRLDQPLTLETVLGTIEDFRTVSQLNF